MKIKPHFRKIRITLCFLVSMLIFGTAAICSGSEYPFDPEETMYLTGIEMTAYREGVRYSLYDIDKDGTSELFVIDENEDPGMLKLFRYDPLTDTARLLSVLGGVTEVYGSPSRNILLTAGGSTPNSLYKEYAVEDDVLVFTDGDTGNDGITSDDENSREPLSWVGSDQWADGSIVGVASRIPDPGFLNDFYLSSNYEWLSETHVKSQGEISSGTNDLENSVAGNKEMMFSDREKYQGEDIQRVRDFYDAAVNWDKRNADGIEPVKKYLDAAAGVSSLSELTDLLTDPERNPFCILMSITITLDEKDTSHWAAELGEDSFSVLPRIYNNESREEVEFVRSDFDIKARHVLLRAGYSSQETEKIMAECYELEDILIPLAWPNEADEDSPLSGFQPFETVTSFCKNFPLKQLLNAYQITGGNIYVYYPGYLEKLDQLYTEENLSLLRSYITAHTAAAASDHLDLEAASCLYGSEDPEEDLQEFLNSGYLSEALSRRGIMSVAVENAYMTYFADPETRTDLIELANEIRDTFRARLSSEDWLSDAGKTAAVEKLDNMTFSVMRPDVMIDSSYLTVDKNSSFLDNYARLTVSTMKHNGAFAGKPRVKGDWRYDLRPEIASSISNAFYYGCFNQFFILSGYVSDSFYRPDMAKEEKLASLGQIIGHELTHGFDPTGIRYDKNGNMVITDDNPCGWMPEEDYQTFLTRAKKISDRFNSILPFPYESCPGDSQWGEAAADIGGLTIGLDIAGKTEGFDYDLYFRKYSGLWLKQSTLNWERSDIYDTHPLSHLRINVTVQQFDEFLSLYDVREGDGMYTAPEDRILIW